MLELPRGAMDRETKKWLEALQPGRRAMHAWIGGLALLSAVVLTAPEAPLVVSAAAQETPKVTVRTLRGPGVQSRPRSTPTRARSRVAATRSTYRRSKPAAASPKRVASKSRARMRSARAASTPRRETAESLNLRAYRLQKQGRHAEAEPLLREALRKRPEFPYAQYNLGWSLVSQGKPGEAILYLKKTSRAQPDRYEPLDKLAEAYERLGKKSDAERARAKAKALRKSRGKERAAGGERAKVAVAPVAWRQSTDHREDAWLRERRELAAVPAPAAPER